MLRTPIPAVLVSVGLASTFFAALVLHSGGVQLTFDSFHYHLFGGWLFLQEWRDFGFMPASVQSYLFPGLNAFYSYAFYKGFDGLGVGLVAAGVRGVAAAPIYLVARGIQRELNLPRWYVWPATGIGFLSVPVLIEASSTFTDLLASIPFLFAIALFSTVRPCGSRLLLRFLFSGLLAGCSVALKLSAMPGMAAIAIFWLCEARRQKSTALPLFLCASFGGVAGFLIIYSSWGLFLYETFGNPFFPFFGSVFGGQGLAPFGGLHERFTPQSLSEFAWRVISFLDPSRGVYYEASAPDFRIFISLLLLPFFALLSRKWEAGDARFAKSVSLFWIGSYFLWAVTSFNGRYFMPGLVLVGPVSLLVGARMLPDRLRNIFIALIVVLQGYLICAMDEFEAWRMVTWGSAPLNIVKPSFLGSEALVLSVGSQSASFLAPYLPGVAGWINIAGQLSFSLDSSDHYRLIEQLNKSKSVYALMRVGSAGAPIANYISALDSILVGYGLNVEGRGCEPVSVSFNAKESMSWLACQVRPLSREKQLERASWHFDRLLRFKVIRAKLEASCPRLFSPERAAAEFFEEGLAVRYFQSDTQLYWRRNGVISLGRYGMLGEKIVGREQGRGERVLDIDCRDVAGRYRVPFSE